MPSTIDEPIASCIGFVGLGAMGKPMVVNLMKKLPAGSKVYVYDIVTSVVDATIAEFPASVVKCGNAREVAESCDVILTMLPEGAHVKAVYLDKDNGIIASLPGHTPKLLVDCSTIDTGTNLFVKEQLLQNSPETLFYDAPVSGGVIGAVGATMAFFLGSSKFDPNISRLDELLSKMGSKVIPCGGPSLGLAAKLSNNYLSGVITIACSEAMDMGMRAGLDADVLASVFSAGTAQNAICDKFNPVPRICPQAPSSNGYNGGFRVQLMKKDVMLAVAMARRLGSRNALGASALGVYAAASEAPDCKDLDSRVVFRYLGGNEEWKKAE